VLLLVKARHALTPKEDSMQFVRPNAEQMVLGLRALKTLALSKADPSGEKERVLLAGIQRVFRSAIDVDTLSPITPDELAVALPDAQIRRQLVDAMVVLSLFGGTPDRALAKRVAGFAKVLGVTERAVKNVEQLARNRKLRLRMSVSRRFWAMDKLRERIREQGFGAAVRFVRATRGRYEDEALAERFRALRALPDGTLGREYVRFTDENGWKLPGERGALPDIIVYHDMTHVLSGYGTDPAGEVQVACFSAGYRRKEPFTFVLFVLLQFHLGVRMTPGSPAEVGFFDVERALHALERGASMNVDLTEGWDYWPVIDVPVEELRRRYGIPPLLPARAAA
jgi:hypothetical protein